MDKLKIVSLLSGKSEVELIPIIYGIIFTTTSKALSIEGERFTLSELTALGGTLLSKYKMTLSDVLK